MKILGERRDVLRRTPEEDESTDTELEGPFDPGALALVTARVVPANRRVEKLGDLAHTGVRFPRTRGPRAPVAEGTFPGRLVTCRYPSNAKATASFASPSKKTSSKWRTCTGAADFWMAANNAGFFAPPPDTSTSRTGSAMNRR